MKIAAKIDKQLEKIADGTIFKYKSLLIEANEYPAAAKKIERLIVKGIIKRTAKGTFYKPKKTIFGEIPPIEEEIIKQYLFKSGKRVAYITGFSLYNQMGLTTQVPTVIEIASVTRRNYTPLSNKLIIKYAKSYVNVEESNYQLLGILDAIKDFNNIPDINKYVAIQILQQQLSALTAQQLQTIITCGLAYPPKVRALLGAILENLNLTVEVKKLEKSLNSSSKYNYNIPKNVLPNSSKWKIR